MPTPRDEEIALKQAVREAHERLIASKQRASRLTEGLLVANQRREQYLASVQQVNEVLKGGMR